MAGVLTGNFGTSWSTREQVFRLVFARFPYTFQLALLSMILTVAVSIPLGIYSAVKQNSLTDSSIMVLSMVLAATPKFWLGILMMLVFSVKLGLLPTSGLGSWKSYIMPTIAMAAASTAIDLRIVRASVLEVIKQDYIRTARAKGIPEYQVILFHALRNAIIPVITIIGPTVAAFLTGSFVIEKIFALPGLGIHFVTSISNRDYTTIMGVTVFYAAFLVIMTLVVDIFYVMVDPRIKLS
jgi:oligopeptide transport system permease protein